MGNGLSKRTERLERESASVRKHLRVLIRGTSERAEKMNVANEEIVSSNEELQARMRNWKQPGRNSRARTKRSVRSTTSAASE